MTKKTTAPAINANEAKEATTKLLKAIDAALKGYDRGRAGIQKAALSVLLHARRYRDYSASIRLVAGLSDSNGKSMRLWFEKFGGISFDLEAQKTSGWKGVQHIEENFEAAKDKPWYTMTPPNAFQGADFGDDLKKVMDKYSKLRAKIAGGKLSEEDRAKVNFDVSEQLIHTLLNMCNFEVVGDIVDTHPVHVAQAETTLPGTVVDVTMPLANAA